MESIANKSLASEIVSRIVEPIKYKLRFYQIALLLFIDRFLSLAIDKYVYLRVKVEEKKINVRIDKLKQSQIKIDLVSTDILRRLKDFKESAKQSLEKLQSMNEDCVSHRETPALFCEPYIHSGFRPINKPYIYYVKSLFSKHNETVNAWSHYIGSIYCLYCAFTLDFSDPYSWPILTSILTSVIMFFTSATAHLMHQKSHYCHMNCFLCDFGGISFNAFGASLMQIHICSPIWYFKMLEGHLLPTLGIQSALCCLLNSIAQTNYKRPYPKIKKFLQFAPCGCLWLFSMLPLFIGLFEYLFYETNENSLKINYAYHITHIGIFLIGAAFFALDFPQRFFPGKLDFIGQGHNIFHVCILSVVIIQLHACYADFQANKHLISVSRQPPSMSYCFLSLAALTTYYIYVIRCFNNMICHNFDDEGNSFVKDEDDKIEADNEIIKQE